MNIRPIRTEEDHAAALKEIERLWGAPVGTPEGDKLDVLTTLVEAYENAHWPIKVLDPIDTIKAHMEATGRSRAELIDILGSRSRASEVMARKRALTINMIRGLASEWHLPAEVLISSYRVKGVTRTKQRKKNAAKGQRRRTLAA
ncbi:transcriptional regulator [Hyphomicrobium sp.]|uniref:helix-turn-helix domain-containing protein n=1 Tax=Hyphomicrobium sp. TaxID=82 RepID=UPI0025BBBE0C|nr:transcriptional regulator [Hyphomicrobium sp.]